MIGDIELFCRERTAHAPRAPFVAITGTNGKSTTTALIAHLMREAGLRRAARRQYRHRDPVARAAAHGPRPCDRDVVLSDRSRAVARSDRRHPDQSHARIISTVTARWSTTPRSRSAWSPASAGGTAVIGVDDDWCQAIADRSSNRASAWCAISVKRPLAGRALCRRRAASCRRGRRRAATIARLGGIGSLRGAHNAQNAAVRRGRGACARHEPDAIAERPAQLSRPCASHGAGRPRGRVAVHQRFQGTNADAAAQALASFDDIFWIAGGKAKEGGIASLAEFFPRIRKAYLIGEAAQDFAETLGGAVPHEMQRDARRRRCACRARRRRLGRAGAGGAAVAGLRVLRPVPEFRMRGDRFRDTRAWRSVSVHRRR